MKSDWEVVIGLETHVQLLTKTKMFSQSRATFGEKSNQNTNEVDMALPGSLPVTNLSAVECAIKFGLAVNAKISNNSVFARKHYFYPDLPKGYQTSQFENPILEGGTVTFFENSEKRTINLIEAHLEEDAGKSIHQKYSSGIDLNRAGIPLLEIVTHPEIKSAQEASLYARTLHELVVWLGICDGNMQEGSFRCDANISVRSRGNKKLGTRTEIKNINSFKFLEKAILFESKRQIDLLKKNVEIVQETRLYDSEKDETRSMRSKENAVDYRYMPDPDLPVLKISPKWIEDIKKLMPELPEDKRNRFEKDYGLSKNEVSQLSMDINISNYFESVVKQLPKNHANTAANWINGEISAFMNKNNININDIPIKSDTLASLINKVIDGTISTKNAKEIFEIVCNTGESNINYLIEKNGLKQITDNNFIIEIINTILKNNSVIVQDYKSGKEKAFNSLIGQVMKTTKGRANPTHISEILKNELDKL
ncbi:aspartyl-tRNA(Asn)/glutamyl-tRNA (Gln) amidotransferase subunit B [Candidatus Kinetoplastibacterium desouzaii TCC079E]|uniref:Aspartyl/glutamyl-tRNA(Asn/Gln) amidotransferase subunit B n=1 Tax=Candidatus Kinetoplastidibacterium desouzai TCC079E TaxID=1208919 RepID=M1L392_9PROT|nr:Asp-tRNA(Asn)/Glu-tRNA(Gln) amidotransferase subunit GatB [Candidatus Kinetoplastibacterium desouzaii]AGF47218.1 aspartyl-tRNA(Asn)/glutamyl-tRNA (Gln) amidotransferase subunit B [Candidatus Kinetoplastibacterium desouzaii TCC079E]